MPIIISVTLGVVFGGIILFLLYVFIQNRTSESAKRLKEHWNEYYGTSLHVAGYHAALDYLKKKYGDKFNTEFGCWIFDRGLMGSPEKRINKLQKLATENAGKKDHDLEMHLFVLHHWAIRQWAKNVGLEETFDNWVKNSINDLSTVKTER